MSYLIAFSGQGAQHANMFDLLKTDNDGKLWLEMASTMLKMDLSDTTLVSKNCYDVVYSQLFLVIQEVGIFNIIIKKINAPLFLCGYSLGEVSAFCASARLELNQIIPLVSHRASMMQEATLQHHAPAGLTVLVGNINIDMVNDYTKQFNCYLAIANANDHFVVGGIKTNLNNLMNAAIKEGVKRVEWINIALPSHTPLLKSASLNFKQYIDQYFSDVTMQYPILNALTNTNIRDTKAMLTILSEELSASLHWDKVMSIATEYQVEKFIEIGPSHTLKNMMNSHAPYLRAYSIADFTTLSGLIETISR